MPILSFLGQLFPGFGPFRGQNQGFCPQEAFPMALFWLSERKSEVFARFGPSEGPFFAFPSAKVTVLRALVLWCEPVVYHSVDILLD